MGRGSEKGCGRKVKQKGKRIGGESVVWYVLFACFFPIAVLGACVGLSALVH